MSTFVRQPIDEKLNRTNPISRIKRLETKTGARASVSVNDLGEIADKISSAKIYAVDVDAGVVRMIMSGESLLSLIGVDAHLAGMANDGTVQFYVDASTGKLFAGGGAVVLDEDGIELPDAGDAIEFSDSIYKAHSHIYLENGIFNLVNYRVLSESNVIANGDFESGSFSSWTETDPSNKLSVVSLDGSYVAKFENSANATEYLTQGFTAADGCVVSFIAKSDSGGSITVTNSGATETKSIYLFDEWRRYFLVFDLAPTSLRFGIDVTGTAYLDNIVVRKKFNSSIVPSIRIRSGISNQIETRGTVIINVDGIDADFLVKGDGDANLLYVDAGLDAVGMGGAAESGYKLKVTGKIKATSTIERLGESIDTGWIPKTETWTARTQAYTNNPAAGADIVLNMTNTSGAEVGGVVRVSSSAGTEDAIINAVVADTSITVNVLALNHTTSSPLVTFLSSFTISGDYSADADYQQGVKIKCTNNSTVVYGVIGRNAVVSSVTYITLVGTNDYLLTNAAITLPYVSKIANPDDFPDDFSFTPGSYTATGTGTPTFTPTTLTSAIWLPVAKTIRCLVMVTGTTGGTTVTAVNITLPFPSASNIKSVPVAAFGTSTPVSVGAGAITTSQAVVRKSDVSDMGIGASRQVRWDGMYGMGA